MKKEFSVAGRLIGRGHPCFIIAEAGVNHNGSVKLALQLVDAAHAAGADAVKFQTFVAEQLASPLAGKAQYQKTNDKRHANQQEMLKSLQLKAEDYRTLKTYCEKKGILFLSSPFDLVSFELLEKLGVAAYKIPSGEITNLQLLKAAAKSGKPVILSTGMSSLQEVRKAYEFLQSNGCTQLAILHCTSEYPAPPSSLNLNNILTLKKEFPVPIGYSDHSRGIEAPALAVGLGACIIEKHFTLDRKMQGPDHAASLEPGGLGEMVALIRRLELKTPRAQEESRHLLDKNAAMLGRHEKEPVPSELATRQLVRKSVFATRGLKAGGIIHEEDLVSKRPMLEGAFKSEELYSLVGRRLRTAIASGAPIYKKDVEA